MVSPRNTAPYGDEATATSNADRPRTISNHAYHQEEEARARTIVISTGATTRFDDDDDDDYPVHHAPAARTDGSATSPAVTPSCLRQEMTSMTLMGLLRRGIDQQQLAYAGATPAANYHYLRPARPTNLAASAGTRWTSQVNESSLLDLQGSDPLRRPRSLHEVLDEALHIIVGGVDGPPETAGPAATRLLSRVPSQ